MVVVILYDGLNLSPQQNVLLFGVDQSIIRYTQKLSFTTPKKVKGDVKVILFQILTFPNPQGTIFCRVWKNATGSNIEVVETSLTTLDARFLPLTPTQFTFPFLGTGELFTNNDVAIGLELVGGLTSQFIRSNISPNQIPNTNVRFFSAGIWQDNIDFDLIVKIDGIAKESFTKSASGNIIVSNPRIIRKTVQIRKGVRSNAQIQ